jgi:hypothetical protein
MATQATQTEGIHGITDESIEKLYSDYARQTTESGIPMRQWGELTPQLQSAFRSLIMNAFAMVFMPETGATISVSGALARDGQASIGLTVADIPIAQLGTKLALNLAEVLQATAYAMRAEERVYGALSAANIPLENIATFISQTRAQASK